MFSNILGNGTMKETLLRLHAGGRLPNAMLFAGPDGVGKKLFAIELARTLLCIASTESGEACGCCSVCARIGTWEVPATHDDRDEFKRVFFGTHGDVGLVVTYKKFILVEAIRALEAESRFRPYEGNARIFIIDEADRMNDAASNALLKTLEEPAPSSHLILVTSRPESLLPTIRSRCQTFRFAPVATDEIERLLISRGASKEDAVVAACVSSGSVGTALTTNVSDLARRRRDMIAVLRAAFVDESRITLLQAAEKLNEAKNKDFVEADIDLLLGLLRDVWAVSLGASPAMHGDMIDELRPIAERGSPSRFAACVDEIEAFRQGLIVNLNKKIGTDNIFLKLAA